MFVGKRNAVPCAGRVRTTAGGRFVMVMTIPAERALNNASSIARADSNCVPGEGLVHEKVKGGAVSSPSVAPSAKNSTRRTVPSGSLALASSRTGEPAGSTALGSGAVRTTVGGALERLGAPAERPVANQLVGSFP